MFKKHRGLVARLPYTHSLYLLLQRVCPGRYTSEICTLNLNHNIIKLLYIYKKNLLQYDYLSKKYLSCYEKYDIICSFATVLTCLLHWKQAE